MTIETKTKLDTCIKCGSVMRYRKRKIATGEMTTVLQCVVCRYYVPISNEDE